VCTEGVKIDACNVVQLLVASDKLGVDEVKRMCVEAIESMSLDDSLRVLNAACEHGLTDVPLLEAKVRVRYSSTK
jgi:hypothetical protein